MKTYYVRWKENDGKLQERSFIGENSEQDANNFHKSIKEYKVKEISDNIYGSVVGVFPNMKPTNVIVC